MLKKLLFVISLIGNIYFSYSQSCPNLLNPVAGQANVAVESTIVWEEIPGVPGYRISLGTTPGGEDIISNRLVGSATFFEPPLGLPENTQIFVTITLFFFDNLDDIVCSSMSFTTESLSEVPECPILDNPENEAINVNVGTNITWDYSPRATSYILSVGTILGGTDIANNINVGNTLTYNPPVNLPTNTEIFIEITALNRIGVAVNCTAQSFITAEIVSNLGCATLISPRDGDSNVPLTPILEWTDVPGATGYNLSIGTTPDNNDILDNGIFSNNRTLVLDFEPNSTLFITIIPFNELGEAINCQQESFSTAIGCGPFLDRTTGEFVSLFPEFDFPDTFTTCENSPPILLSTDVEAESYRWVTTTSIGTEIATLSETQEVEISEGGFYKLEVSNFADSNGNNIPCTTAKEFIVEVLEGPIVESVDVERNDNNLRFIINVTGNSQYEYSLNNIEGPYQSSNIFTNAPLGDNIVYIRDIMEQNCIVSEEIQADSIREGFPNFFTPNGDSTNDFWQFAQPPNTEEVTLRIIRIYDRFGKLLAQIDPQSVGWDGTFNGRPLPTGGYWFKAVDDSEREIQGFFTLKR
ncbi:T9SS type B sorting domain-containing protein [uncultured Croceitalea sp.]|uniref:T9SS type B sorting domain-containing protein n=1 Tax=uncultured Croceitalea sp. TaxID=1798908 RepID=UPI00374F563F